MTLVQYLQLVAVACFAIALLAPRWHGVRRTLFGYLGRRRFGHCVSCGRRMTDAERHYYGNQCERCEAHDLHELDDR